MYQTHTEGSAAQKLITVFGTFPVNADRSMAQSQTLGYAFDFGRRNYPQYAPFSLVGVTVSPDHNNIFQLLVKAQIRGDFHSTVKPKPTPTPPPQQPTNGGNSSSSAGGGAAAAPSGVTYSAAPSGYSPGYISGPSGGGARKRRKQPRKSAVAKTRKRDKRTGKFLKGFKKGHKKATKGHKKPTKRHKKKKPRRPIRTAWGDRPLKHPKRR